MLTPLAGQRSKRQPEIEFQEYDPRKLSLEFEHEWAALELRALEPNIYLSPHFVLAALQHLDAEQKPLILALFGHYSGKKTLLAVCLFSLSPARKNFPLTHLVAYKSAHSYIGGMLIDAQFAEQTLTALFEYLTQPGASWHGIRFDDMIGKGPTAQMCMRIAAISGVSWHLIYSYERAVLCPTNLTDAAVKASVDAAGGKDIARRVRRLKEVGEFKARTLWGKEITDEAIENFLALEDRQWTRESGTSLLASGDGPFFRQLCQALRDESRIFIYELTINGAPIASAVNFISVSQGFAFKIGWEQKYAKMSPGIINELEFMRDIASNQRGLSQIDSGATAGSFIEKIWPNRTTIASGIFVTSRRGKLAMQFIEFARLVKNKLHKYRK